MSSAVFDTIQAGLGDKPYMDGDELTVADFFIGYILALALRGTSVC